MNNYINPVIKGFSPDPTICAVGEDYYLATSTFSYFPGVPIYHSKDLVHWEQIGNALTRKSQLNLEGAGHSRGIFAPCLRYHDGIFYMITTNVSHGGNFIVTTEDPAGEWSEPYFLDNAPGIDPSLFFDEDGRCYYIGTRPNPTGPKYNGDWEVWLQELDLETMKLIGVSTKIWEGAMVDVIWPEAPHIYKINGYYYLLIAEGGTGFNHCVTIARSKNIEGPYENNPNNPILTHRHLGRDFPVWNVGHADIVETPENDWYLVCLASRPYDGYSNLGRETFLAEMIWEDGWPVVNPGEGRLLEEAPHKLPLVPYQRPEKRMLAQHSPEYVYLRNPYMENYDRSLRNGWLRLHPTNVDLTMHDSPTYLGIRQESMYYDFQAKADANLIDGEEAGIVILQSDEYSMRLVITPSKDTYEVKMITILGGEENVVKSINVSNSEVVFGFRGIRQKLTAYLLVDNSELIVADDIDTHYLSTEVAGGFVGCTLGIYAYSPHSKDKGYVDFEWIAMKDLEK